MHRFTSILLNKLKYTTLSKPLKILLAYFKNLLANKTILYISNKKIKSFSVNSFLQIAFLIFSFGVADLFVRSIAHKAVLDAKDTKIVDLKRTNKQFRAEVNSLNKNLNEIDKYFTALAKYDHVKSDEQIARIISRKSKNMFKTIRIDKDDQYVANKIAQSNHILDNIRAAAKKRALELESKISFTKLRIAKAQIVPNADIFDEINEKTTEISLNSDEELSKKQGGPFQEISEEAENEENQELVIGRVSIDDEINYLSELENFIHHAPLSTPMRSYYISSRFGARTDPIKKIKAKHNGIDFVGSLREKIISPSFGIVKFSGKFGAYGRTLIIDHGYGITTRYGHLSKSLVNEGDYVKRGDEIAIQGSSGRSTGSHLHYEVRHNNKPIDPKNFLYVGKKIFEKPTKDNKQDNI